MMPDRTQSSTRPGQGQVLLLRFSGDLTTKADATRRHMTRRLLDNLRASIKASGRTARVKQSRSRLYVELDAPPPAPDPLDPTSPRAPSDAEMVERLARVFGIQSVSLTHAVPWQTLDDVVREGLAFGEPWVRGKRFAIRARRMGERHEVKLRSADIQERLGSALRPGAAGVDLSHPDVTLHVEVDPALAYYFVAKEPGAGGLPLGTQGRAVSLLSGGFDSPVASWRMLRRGVALDYVFCNLGGRSHQLETLAIAKRMSDLWQCGTRPRFHAVDFDLVSREIQKSVTTRFWQLVLKRMMLRAAAAVAARIDGLAIVTGDAIGQVSSQTLQNLAVVSHGCELPILRPLVGDNKDDIIAEARRIGTHDLSEKVGEYCAIVPSHPATSARLSEVLAEEAKLDPSVLERALAERSEFMLPDLDLAGWDAEALCARELLPGEILIDLRSRTDFDAWHAPGALFLDFPNALRAYAAFDKSQRYVLYCEWGLKSAHLADLMRREGLAARHVSGGVREVRRMVENALG
jgi:thiamine biosynthesis protein ThiI